MGTQIFLGKPPANIEQWIRDHHVQPTPVAPDGKVLYRTTAGGDWLQDDARIISGAFTGFANKGSAVEVIIPSKDASGNGVTSIWSRAFYNCSGLTSVTIPDSMTSIGSEAFSGCSGLTSVTIPDGVTSVGEKAFYGCSDSLFDTTTISGVKLVDGWAVGNTGSLSGALNLTGIRGIGTSAFSGCSGLTSVTIPNSVTTIGSSAFENCSGLTSVTIGNNVEKIGSDAFYSCTSVNDVYCWPNPANLTWNEGDKDDFKEDGSTLCHVKAEYLAAYKSKFGDEVNVTFVGDLA